MSLDLRDVLFWIFLLLSLGLVLWTVFGRSPTEFIATVSLILTGLFKTWSLSNRVIRLETRLEGVERNFALLAHDFKQHARHK